MLTASSAALPSAEWEGGSAVGLDPEVGDEIGFLLLDVEAEVALIHERLGARERGVGERTRTMTSRTTTPR